LRETASREELDALGVALDDHLRATAPLAQDMTDGEIVRLAEVLKKTHDWTLLDRCVPSTLRALVRSMASAPEPSAGSTCSTTMSDGAASPAT